MDLKLYTDGSYSKATPDVVKGGMVILIGDELVTAQRYITKKQIMTTMNNVGGELLAATCGLFIAGGLIANTLGSDDASGVITIYHDYRGIYEFVAGPKPWVPKQEGSKFYVRSVQEFRKMYPNIKIKFVKIKSHSGDKWNNVVDTIANGIDPIECKGKMMEDYIQPN